jgi:sulfite reductase (NADPH) flavoprotein alpha-component
MSDAESQAAVATEGGYSKKNPFPSTLKQRRLLNKPGSTKEVQHLELCLAGSGLEYQPGDSLAIIPTNSDRLVADVMETGGLDADAPVELANGDSAPLGQALKIEFDVSGLTKSVLKKYNQFAQSENIEALLDPENAAGLKEYLWGREVVDLLSDFPVAGMSAGDFCSILRKISPRLYSIASSPLAHPGEVHLTIAVLRYHSHGRDREGVCSTYAVERIGVGETMPVFLHHDKHFKLPGDGDTPIIMVGPGTGIAPFRAFVEERAATGADGKSWLFFGDRNRATDFLYGEEFERYHAEGKLTRIDLAFSRDQAEKVYVQHRMLENGAKLFAWLNDGATFYVCGDASRMAGDVHEALITIAEREGGLSREAAEAWLKHLQDDRRYLRDVY